MTTPSNALHAAALDTLHKAEKRVGDLAAQQAERPMQAVAELAVAVWKTVSELHAIVVSAQAVISEMDEAEDDQ